MPMVDLSRWSKRDRRLAAGFLFYLALCFVHNHTRTSPVANRPVGIVVTWVAQVAVLAIFGFLAWSLARRRCSPGALGFTLDTRSSILVTLVAGVYLPALLIRFPPAKEWLSPFLALPFIAVIVEEILFRPFLITRARDLLFADCPHARELAIVLSAALWAAVHLPSKPLSLVIGLFITGLIVGALYAYTGTNVFSFVLHASANTGPAGAAFMFGLCLLMALAGRTGSRAGTRAGGASAGAEDERAVAG